MKYKGSPGRYIKTVSLLLSPILCLLPGGKMTSGRRLGKGQGLLLLRAL